MGIIYISSSSSLLVLAIENKFTVLQESKLRENQNPFPASGKPNSWLHSPDMFWLGLHLIADSVWAASEADKPTRQVMVGAVLL